MTTILILNAVGCFLAALGIGGFLVRQERQSLKARVAPLYVTAGATGPRPHR